MGQPHRSGTFAALAIVTAGVRPLASPAVTIANPRLIIASMASAALLLSACSVGDTPDGVAEDLIEGQLATDFGLGEITATCAEPANNDPGATFTCTSPTDFGEVEWLATMADEKTVEVESVNLVTKEILPQIEQAAVTSLENQLGVPLGVENFDCGVNPVVLTAELTMVCALTDPADASLVYDATLAFTDLETGSFDVEVAEQPRS
jgi:hypothetical protein